MAGRSRTLLYGSADVASGVNPFPIQNQLIPGYSSEPHHNSIFMSAASSSFLGSRSMVSFEDVSGRKRPEKSLFGSYDQEDNGDEDLDEYFRQPEKKRRLTVEQVQFLEKSFELENKLEPETKIELAKELGLQPRQVSIWFQNRRARWKTKQLEKDYDALQASYNNLKTDYDNLLKEKDALKAEMAQITEKLLVNEKETGNSKSSHGSNLSAETTKDPSADSVSEDEVSKGSALAFRQEDHSSAKSDVLDSDSPRYNEGVRSSSLLERGDSSYIFEPDQSDVSQDEEDKINKHLFRFRPTYVYPKIEDACYSDPPSSSYFGFPVDDQAFGFWPM